jgi:hypothetical protein
MGVLRAVVESENMQEGRSALASGLRLINREAGLLTERS